MLYAKLHRLIIEFILKTPINQNPDEQRIAGKAAGRTGCRPPAAV
jgi:hypothetical protein